MDPFRSWYPAYDPSNFHAYNGDYLYNPTGVFPSGDGTLEEYEPFGVLDFRGRAPGQGIYTSAPLPWYMDAHDHVHDMELAAENASWSQIPEWRDWPPPPESHGEFGLLREGFDRAFWYGAMDPRRYLNAEEERSYYHGGGPYRGGHEDAMDLWRQLGDWGWWDPHER